MSPEAPARFHLREAGPDDAPLLHALVSELAEFERLAHNVTGSVDELRAALTAGHCHALLAVTAEGGQPAGFALWFHNFSTFLARRGLYLEDLFVRPAWRRHGLGKMLLKRLAQIAVERGCGRFEWAVLDWNESAIQFYRSLGAQAVDEWTIFRLTDEPLRRLAGASGE